MASTFSISEFTNPSGEIVFRVAGWLDGKRVRKNFTNHAAAVAERQTLEIHSLQSDTDIRTTATRLTDSQLHEAESAFRRLTDAPKSLSFYLDYALANYRASEREIKVEEAITTYLAGKKQDHERGMLSTCQLKDIRLRLDALKKWFPGKLMSELSRDALSAHCQRGNPKPKTFNNRRGILFTFFKFAFCRDWVAANPLEKVPHLRIAHRRGSATTLSATQVEALMRYVETREGGAFVPFFALALFAGIRPCLRTGEIFKLKPEHVRLDTGVIHIEPEVSKVRMKRRVTIQPNLAAWLRAYPLESFPIIIPNLQKLRAKFVKEFGLSHDIMRHTFISMHVAKFRSMGEAALQAGNSESIIRKHYLDLKTAAEAEQFFGILPAKCAAPLPTPLPFPAPAAALAAAG